MSIFPTATLHQNLLCKATKPKQALKIRLKFKLFTCVTKPELILIFQEFEVAIFQHVTKRTDLHAMTWF